MPSLHAADALIVGVVLFSVCRSRWAKALWAAWPGLGVVLRDGDRQPLLARLHRRYRSRAALDGRGLPRPPTHVVCRSSGVTDRLATRRGQRTQDAATVPRVTRAAAIKARLHDWRARARVTLGRQPHPHESHSERTHRERRAAVRRRLGARALREPKRACSSTGSRRSCSSSGSVLDILDGALARAGGKTTPFGAFIDSTTDRVSEGFMLTAIAYVLATHHHPVFVAVAMAGVAGSFLVSYTRAQSRGTRPARRRGHRLTRRARGRDHRGARARPLGRPPVGARAPRRHRVADRRAARPARPQATDGGQQTMSEMNGNARGRQQEKVRVAIIGVGNCSNSFMQGLTYYHEAKRDEFVPGLMHVDLGGYHISDVEVVAAFDVVKGKVGVDLADAIWAHPNDTIKFADVPKTGVTVSRGMTLDGIGKYLSQVVEKDDEPDRRHRRHPQGPPGRRRRQLPAGRLGGRDQVVRRADHGGRLRDGELHAGLHRPRGLLEHALPGGRRADHRRRHQVAGRRHDHAPRAHLALPRARRPPRQDDAAERRRQLRLPEHARARASRVEEDLEDERRHVDARLRPRRRQRARRPVRLRAVADRPQVGVHPPRGVELRRRAAERRDEARGVGLAELGRHRDRRRPAREARAEQRHLRLARRPELVPDEVAAAADPGRRRSRAGRRVHRAQPPRDLRSRRRRRSRSLAGRPSGRPVSFSR